MKMANVACVDVPSFQEEREKMRPLDRGGIKRFTNFVEYSETGDFGFYLFRIMLVDDSVEVRASETFDVRMTEHGDRIVKTLVYPKFPDLFEKMQLKMNFVSINLGPVIMFENFFKREDVGIETQKFDLVQRHLSKMLSNANFVSRMLPRGIMKEELDLLSWLRKVDVLLDTQLPENSIEMMSKILGRVDGTKIKSRKKKKKQLPKKMNFGQFFLGLFLKRYDNFENVAVNTKLMLLSFACLLHAEDAMRSYLITSIHNWIALDGCDSCIDKVLRDFISDNYPYFDDLEYEYGNYSSINSRWIEFKVKFSYKIYDCGKEKTMTPNGDYMPVSASVIPIYSHSALVIQSKKSRVCVSVGQNEVILGYHIGVSLYRVVSLFAAAMRDTHFTGDNDILYKKMVALEREAKNNSCNESLINTFIFDLCAIHCYHNVLSDLARRLLFVLFYGIIPKEVLRTFDFSGNDYYGSALDSLLNTDWYVFDKGDFRTLLFRGTDSGYIRAVLESPGRKNALRELFD